MKAAESIDDVTTALSAQASLEREKALRRSAPAASPGQLSDDLEFADPEADDEVEDQEEEESLDDELSDEDEVISAGGAIEEEEDADDAATTTHDGVATATFMKPADSTGLSGLLNPRRPPTGTRTGVTASAPACRRPAPATRRRHQRARAVDVAVRVAARPGARGIALLRARRRARRCPRSRFPPPSGAAATPSEPGFFTQASAGAGCTGCWRFGGSLALGFGLRRRVWRQERARADRGGREAGRRRPRRRSWSRSSPAARPRPERSRNRRRRPPPRCTAKPTPAVADLPGSRAVRQAVGGRRFRGQSVEAGEEARRAETQAARRSARRRRGREAEAGRRHVTEAGGRRDAEARRRHDAEAGHGRRQARQEADQGLGRPVRELGGRACGAAVRTAADTRVRYGCHDPRARPFGQLDFRVRALRCSPPV